MSSRVSIQQFVSTTEPVGVALGDEWLNPSTGILYKRTIVNNQVGWLQILSAPSVSVTSVTVTGATASSNPTSGALQVSGGVGVGGSVYARTNLYSGNRIGYINSNNVSVAYQFYNTATNSIDTVFG